MAEAFLEDTQSFDELCAFDFIPGLKLDPLTYYKLV